jgi:hypothetical protein
VGTTHDPQVARSTRLRKVLTAAVLVASALLGVVVPSVAAADGPTSDAKVVIIVGADTPQ